MDGNRSFLILGSQGGDLTSLLSQGYEIDNMSFSLEQGVDLHGKATTRVFGGSIHLTLSQLPPDPIIEWAIQSRKRMEGAIVVLDYDNTPVEKILFKNAACVEFDFSYTMEGNCYAQTSISIQAEELKVGKGVDIHNEWKED